MLIESTMCVLALSGGIAATGVDDTAELQGRLDQLNAQIAQLEAANGEQWLTEQRASEIRGLVQDVLADADTRGSLLQDGVTGGWVKGQGFSIASADGNFLLKIGGQIQIRAVYNIQDNSPTDDDRFGFENRRSKFIITGHVVDPSWQFNIQGAFNRSGGLNVLEDQGWIQKDLGDGWKVRVGQTKAPFLREEIVSSARQFTIERSLINSFFTAGTVQGIQLSKEADHWRFMAMYHDGAGTANTVWSTEDTEFAISGRFDWLAKGTWKQFDDYNGFRGDDSGILVGAAVNWQKGEFGTGSNLPAPDFNNAEVENLGLTADLTLDFNGASLSGAAFYRHLETDTGSPGDLEADQWGFIVRGGYFFSDEWEGYAQYEWADPDLSGVSDLSVLTVGVTKYWDRHNLKWQTDVGWGIDSVSSVFAQDGAGWRTDSSGEEDQIVIRSQLQLLF